MSKKFWNNQNVLQAAILIVALKINQYTNLSSDFSGENTDSAKSEICKLDADKGTCDENNQRWHYSAARSTCELFNWGGCAGNR